MFKFITKTMMFCVLSFYTLISMAGVSPLTAIFQSDTSRTSFPVSASIGSANYLVNLNSAVGTGASLGFNVSNLPSWATVTNGTSQCSATTRSCGSSFSLKAGESCCLMLHLDGTNIASGNYSLEPYIKSIPPAYSFSALPVTVAVAPLYTINISPSTIPAGELEAEYYQALTASGGTAPYTYAITQGVLPAGLNLSTSGVISGTPTAAGSQTFTVTATDYYTITGSKSYALNINTALTTTNPANITANNGQTITFSTTTSGSGTPYAYQWQVSLDGGLTFSNIIGASSASYSKTAVQNDSGQQYRVVVTDAISVSVTSSAATLTVNPSLVLTSSQPTPSHLLYNGTYSQDNTASGGSPPYTYSILSGSLPPGTSLNTASGTVSGTLTQIGSFAYTIKVTDSLGATASGTQITAIVDATEPSAPVSVTASAPIPSGIETITWTAPSNTGGVPISSYTVNTYLDNTLQGSITVGNVTTTQIQLLTTGTYTFTVAATNSVGTGPTASTFPGVTLTSSSIATATNVIPSPGNGQVTISWTGVNTTPYSTTGYTVVSSPFVIAPAACTIIGNTTGATDCTFTGLTNGTSYTFTVVPYNTTAGFGITSSSSSEVTPSAGAATVPGPPIGLTVVQASPTSVTASWLPPTNAGGSSITNYTVKYGPTIPYTTTSGCTTTGALTCPISNITPGATNIFTVTATNAQGTSIATYSGPITTATKALTANAPTLALAASGQTRSITITNIGGSTQTIGTVSFTGAPSGTTKFADTCSNQPLAVGAQCSISIQPGTLTSGPCTSGVTPTSATITVPYTDDEPIMVDVVVLSYGCFYQGGYLFSIDDTTPTIRSIGGIVADTTDLLASIWAEGFNSIWGIAETSTISSPSPGSAPASLRSGQLNCNGNTDGTCGTNNIVLVQSAGAAKQCSDLATGNYINWYLPSICEMGYQSSGSSNSYCGTSGSPTLQNMQSNLFNNGVGNLSGSYWSTTETVSNSQYFAWYQNFTDNIQDSTYKADTYAVRCVRSLTD